eukprot:1368162-Alexandrium_andersonii.AAC.1
MSLRSRATCPIRLLWPIPPPALSSRRPRRPRRRRRCHLSRCALDHSSSLRSRPRGPCLSS